MVLASVLVVVGTLLSASAMGWALLGLYASMVAGALTREPTWPVVRRHRRTVEATAGVLSAAGGLAYGLTRTTGWNLVIGLSAVVCGLVALVPAAFPGGRQRFPRPFGG